MNLGICGIKNLEYDQNLSQNLIVPFVRQKYHKDAFITL